MTYIHSQVIPELVTCMSRISMRNTASFMGGGQPTKLVAENNLGPLIVSMPDCTTNPPDSVEQSKHTH